MADLKWRFRKMSPAEVNQGTVVREFFEDEPINTRLVREAIQNSLDAALGKTRGAAGAGPVRVRFALGGINNPLPMAKAARYCDGIAPHLAEIDELDDGLRERARSGNPAASGMPYIVVEDAGTQGLGGDWTEYDTTDPDNHFYWFFRNIGLSGKGDSDNGSWGLGKWVFPDASHVSAYLAVTRRPDGETLLMGQTVLTKHTINGQRYDPVGYFGVQNHDDLTLPLQLSNPEHRPFIEQCIADFDLQFRNESGLSLIVPFPRVGSGKAAAADDTDADDAVGVDLNELIAAVVHNYFYPIIAGKLEVIIDAGDGTNPTVVSAATISGVVDRLDLPATGERSIGSYRRLFAMCRDSINRRPTDYEVLPALPSGNRERYAETQLAVWRARYQAGEVLAFRIGTDVDRRGEGKKATALRLYLQQDATLTEGHDYYVRGTLSIYGHMDFIRPHREACALMVVDETEPLAAMLRDSEPPAHTYWRPDSSRAFNRWVAARHRIQAVRSTPGNLLRLLEMPTDTVQKDAFTDIFFWDGNRSRPTNTRIRESPGGYNTDRGKPDGHRPPDFDITRTGNGFRVTIASGSTDPPTRALLQVAYETPRGNPLSRYVPSDFRLHGRGEKLSLQVGGCRFEPGKDGNEMFLDIDNPDDFEFAVSGFDPLRDVFVKVERVDDTANADDSP